MINRAFVVSALAACCIGGAAANADIYIWNVTLSPEVPGATGTGTASFTLDTTARTLAINTSWSGLSGLTTVAHIHAPTAAAGTGTVGVAVTPGTLPSFPTGLSSGSYSVVIDLSQSSSYTGSFLNGPGGGTTLGAQNALLSAMLTNRAYLNIHSSTFTGGEIRGFIPTPGAAAAMGLLGLAALRRRR